MLETQIYFGKLEWIKWQMEADTMESFSYLWSFIPTFYKIATVCSLLTVLWTIFQGHVFVSSNIVYVWEILMHNGFCA